MILPLASVSTLCSSGVFAPGGGDGALLLVLLKVDSADLCTKKTSLEDGFVFILKSFVIVLCNILHGVLINKHRAEPEGASD